MHANIATMQLLMLPGVLALQSRVRGKSSHAVRVRIVGRSIVCSVCYVGVREVRFVYRARVHRQDAKLFTCICASLALVLSTMPRRPSSPRRRFARRRRDPPRLGQEASPRCRLCCSRWFKASVCLGTRKHLNIFTRIIVDFVSLIVLRRRGGSALLAKL